MPKLLIGLGLVVAFLTLFAVVDAAMYERARIRGLPRWVWIFVIVLVPVIGPLLWFFVGHGRRGAPTGRVVRSVAPDDDPDFLKGLDREKDQQERIRQLEQELANLDEPDPPTGASTGTAGPAGPAGPASSDPKKSEPGEGEQPGRRDA